MWLDWLVFCDCGFCLSAFWCLYSAPTVVLGLLWSWTWVVSSRPLTPPVPHSHHSPLLRPRSYSVLTWSSFWLCCLCLNLLFLWGVCGCVHTKLLQSCPTLCNPMDCCLPGSSVFGILQAKILEWIAIPSSRGSSIPRDWTCVSFLSCLSRKVLYH